MKVSDFERPPSEARWLRLCLAFGALVAVLAPVQAANLAAPPSLKTVQVPEPPNLAEFVKSKQAAIVLGKALFWDVKVGSDGVQACASCHFHAGADNRAKNTLNPGASVAGDSGFRLTGPNGLLTATMFPLHKLSNPDDRFSVVSDANDVVGSQGIHKTDFVKLAKKGEVGTPIYDDVYNVGGYDVRRVTGRNAPSAINAVFNFANFWDGRANNIFNGSSPFGDADPDAGVYVTDPANGNLVKVRVRIPMASLASQAVGPPGSDVEMAYHGRTFSTIARKLMAKTGNKLRNLVPLSGQKVHPQDSMLGSLSNSTITKGQVSLKPGLRTTYSALIMAAFQDKFWNSGKTVTLDTDTYTQMEANFSLFFGLAIQLYEATLVSDDSPYDRFQDCIAGLPSCDDNALSASAKQGLNIFLDQNEQGSRGGIGGSCINCHGTSTFTNASVMHLGSTNFDTSLPEALLELMTMGDQLGSFYDAGYYDIGVRPIEEDPGRGGTDPFGYPLSFTDRSLLLASGSFNFPSLQSVDPNQPVFNPFLPCAQPGFPPTCPSVIRSATKGSFKVPTLRNVELTGPYFHNGGQATLRQVVDFYTRGGDFPEANIATLDPDIGFIFGLAGNPAAKKQVVDFLLSLTDERVRWEKAPFDHPELPLPNGAVGDTLQVKACGKPAVACDATSNLPAVGAGGLAAVTGKPIGTFLNLDPHRP
jgi:cytochrome c peroxidase